MATTSMEETVLSTVYTTLSSLFSNVSFGAPEITDDGTYVWVGTNVEKDVYYYDSDFEVYLIYIYVSSIDYIAAMSAAHTIRTLFHKKSITLTGFTNINSYCAARDIITEDDFEGIRPRTLRIIPVNMRVTVPPEED